MQIKVGLRGLAGSTMHRSVNSTSLYSGTSTAAGRLITPPSVHESNRRQRARSRPIPSAAAAAAGIVSPLAASTQQQSPPNPVTRHPPVLLWQLQQQLQPVPAAEVDSSIANRQHAAHYGSSSGGGSRRNSSGNDRSNSSNKLDDLLVLLKSRPPSNHPALLTAAIRAATTWQQAAAVFSSYSHSFNNIHTAAFISHLPKVLRLSNSSMHRPSSDLVSLLQDISVLAEDILPLCSDRELVNIAQGSASIKFYNRRLMQLLLCRCDLARLKPQELAGITWAVAKLGHEVHEGWVQQVIDVSRGVMADTAGAAAPVEAEGSSGNPTSPFQAAAGVRLPQQQQWQQQQQGCRGPGFKPQELCNLVWGLAVMQRRCLLHSAPPLRYRCTVVDVQWKNLLCVAAAAAVQQYNAADVAMCLWGLAVLGFSKVPQSWLQLMLARACDQVHDMQGRHIAVVLWASSRLLRGQQQQQCSFTAAESGMSDLDKFTALCFPALNRLVKLQGREQQQQRGQLRLACVVLLSSAHLEVRPSAAVMATLLAAAAVQLNQYSSDRRQQQQSDVLAPSSSSSSNGDVWHQWSNVPLQQQQQHVTVHDVTMLLFGAARLSYRPSRSFMAAAMAAAAAAIWQQGIAPGIVGRGGHPDPAAAAAAPLQARELSMLLWSLAKLHYKPPDAILRLVTRAAVEQLNSFSSRDIAVMLWALSKMHHAPKFKWVRRMLRQFLTRLDDGIDTAPDICQVLYALPQLPSAQAKNLNRILLSQISDLLPQLAAAAASRFSECGARELVGIVQGFARLGYYPGDSWQQQHCDRCVDLMSHGVRFSDTEQQVLEHSRIILDTLAQQQQQLDGQLLVDRQKQVGVAYHLPQLAGV